MIKKTLTNLIYQEIILLFPANNFANCYRNNQAVYGDTIYTNG